MKKNNVKKFIAKSLPLLFLLFLPIRAEAANYYVASGGSDTNDGLTTTTAWKTISHALENVTVGTINVAAGTYSAIATGETFPLKLKDGVSLLGADKTTTILTGGNNTGVITIQSVSGGMLAGFTIRNGKAPMGAGIKIDNSNINITGNIITQNSAGSGAGIYASNFSGIINQNTIYSNYASGTGGGIRLVDSGGSLTQNEISQNKAGAGGGIYAVSLSSQMSSNQLIGNQAFMHGGGMYVAESTSTINYNLIRDNQAIKGNGGGIYAVNFSGNLNNNLIVKNSANSSGGIYAANFEAGSEIINNTIADNTGVISTSIGGMQASGVSSVLKNNIFWNNGNDDLYGGLEGNPLGDDPLTSINEGTIGISYSLIQDYSGLYNNIYADPQFVDPANYNYRLSATSPAIDVGTDVGAPGTDLEGNSRPQGAGVDMGAYEYTTITSPPPSGATIIVHADKHYIHTGSHPGSDKMVYSNLTVGAYSKLEGSCVASYYGTSWQYYPDIVYGDQTDGTPACSPAASGITDTEGNLTLAVEPGDYLIIGTDDAEMINKHLGTSALVAEGETVYKYLQLLITENGKKLTGKSTIQTGSELLIVEPEYVDWSGTQELYPFVFKSLDNWQVTVDVTPPAGFVPDYNSLSENVDNEVEAVQFTLTETGSKWNPTKVKYRLSHQGNEISINSEIDVVPPDSGDLLILAEKVDKIKGKSVTEPLANLLIRLYDTSKGSCAADIGTSWKNYPAVVAGCTPDYSGTTNESGQLKLFHISVGEYLVIGGDGTDKDLGTIVEIVKDKLIRTKLSQKVTAGNIGGEQLDTRKRKVIRDDRKTSR